MLVIAFLYLPIVLLVVFSFNDSRLNLEWRGFTLSWYQQLWADACAHVSGARHVPLIAALLNSLVIAGVTAGVSAVMGTAGAWLLHRYRFPARRLLETLLVVPMVVPEVIMGVSLLVLFAACKIELGFATVIAAHVTFCFPFVLAAVKARLDGMDPALEEAALDLGATPLRAFLHVIVPWIRPGIISGALMAFTLSLDELIVTWFTRGPGSTTLPVQIYGMAKVGLDPGLNAISTVLILATVFVVILAESFKKKGSLSAT